jgi:hypothetical protein
MHFRFLRTAERRYARGHRNPALVGQAARGKRTVSVCVVFRRAKRGRFAYFALKLALPGDHPSPKETIATKYILLCKLSLRKMRTTILQREGLQKG